MTTTTQQTDTPTADWATWALLQSAFAPGALDRDSLGFLLAIRLANLTGPYAEAPEFKPGPRTFVVVTSSFRWGRGKTLADACRAARAAGSPTTAQGYVWLVLNDLDPRVNGYGTIEASSSAEIIEIGPIGPIGAAIRAGAHN